MYEQGFMIWFQHMLIAIIDYTNVFKPETSAKRKYMGYLTWLQRDGKEIQE